MMTDHDNLAIALSVNGQPHRVPDGSTLADLITHLGQAPQGLATALNGEFVARESRANQRLRAGDQVTCFQAIVGG